MDTGPPEEDVKRALGQRLPSDSDDASEGASSSQGSVQGSTANVALESDSVGKPLEAGAVPMAHETESVGKDIKQVAAQKEDMPTGGFPAPSQTASLLQQNNVGASISTVKIRRCVSKIIQGCIMEHATMRPVQLVL